MRFPYRAGLNIAEDTRIVFKSETLKGYAIGVMREPTGTVAIVILSSASGDFVYGPVMLDYWFNLTPDLVKLSIRVYDIFQNDDWQSHTDGLYFETYRTQKL